MNKNMKKALMVMASLISVCVLSGCEENTREATQVYKMPPGMEDCKVYYMSGKDGSNIVVVRCPNSTTSTRSGKSSTVTVVEGANAAASEQVSTSTQVVQPKNAEEVQINGETYRKSDTMKEVEINGETYKKVQ